MANTWQGNFPVDNDLLDGFMGTSPVRSFPPNGYGLFDVAGNVWEWTDDWFSPQHTEAAPSPCCAPVNPRVTSPEQSYQPGQPGDHIPRRVIKGGSHLCAPNYCLRYRPAAGRRSRWTPRPRTSASAASCARSAIPVRPDRRQRRREYPAGLVHLGPVLVPIGAPPRATPQLTPRVELRRRSATSSSTVTVSIATPTRPRPPPRGHVPGRRVGDLAVHRADVGGVQRSVDAEHQRPGTGTVLSPATSTSSPSASVAAR